ncbi:coiled-coil domain-containing protein [Holotrichia oblita]|uniref:Coiled-coil domain-containing protein n=1 Tax=Holotrichia oblita TaxID=644536 RepID=A0ACB9TU12_HOLOL|nr:coiled-coil domain-containing protein [Holotrichia oblita]
MQAVARVDLDNAVMGDRQAIRHLLADKHVASYHNLHVELLYAEMEDRLITAAVGQFPIEMQCKILTSHVHDANLKKEATIVIHESYKKIINVCKKDAIYFDVMLDSLRDDRVQQGKCLRNAIILGQLATEYLCDRKEEFQVLETIIQKDMQTRQIELDELIGEVQKSSRILKRSVRRR